MFLKICDAIDAFLFGETWVATNKVVDTQPKGIRFHAFHPSAIKPVVNVQTRDE